MSRSIYWKITVPLMALVLLIMGVLGFYVVNSSRNTQISHLESQLINEARLVANISTPSFADSAKRDNLDTLAESIGNEIVTRGGIDGTVVLPHHDDDGIFVGKVYGITVAVVTIDGRLR